ncbi:uncharacterized protein LOC119188177 isoform X1 [Rhipicephalus microplus]|uniref:uncharacterized protein LOC119188177 isoform X1 n=1 Tax=Rhipicephalus microplus TaxID=6941 RepID=UPI003F6CBF23
MVFRKLQPFCGLTTANKAVLFIATVSGTLSLAGSLAAFLRILVASSDSRIIPDYQGTVKGACPARASLDSHGNRRPGALRCRHGRAWNRSYAEWCPGLRTRQCRVVRRWSWALRLAFHLNGVLCDLRDVILRRPSQETQYKLLQEFQVELSDARMGPQGGLGRRHREHGLRVGLNCADCLHTAGISCGGGTQAATKSRPSFVNPDPCRLFNAGGRACVLLNKYNERHSSQPSHGSFRQLNVG